jgi:enediyne biosynthesis protein E4
MTRTFGWLRRQSPGIVALIMVVGGFLAVRLPTTSSAEAQRDASRYAFTPMSIALPSGYRQQNIRRVNKTYKQVRAWISSVGAGVAMNDLDGDGLANDLCLVDPRIDQAVVTPTPGARSNRYAPFALNPKPLPMNDHMAPMGCLPGDFNEDGRMDLLVYMWGRTPILYAGRPGAKRLSAAAYRPTELVHGPNSRGGTYTGPEWNTNAASFADFDGDGHDDLYIGNYFPDGPVLDDRKRGGVTLNRSMSNAQNGGEDHFFRWKGANGFQRIDHALPQKVSRGWTLAAASTDLDGDQLPELYIGNDFGPDRMLYNRSRPGHIRFGEVADARSRALTPKSKRIGHDSFKGMGVDFGDLNGDGIYDMFVSNITTSFGLQESNFAYMSAARNQRDLRRQFGAGEAPWRDRSAPLGLAWSGWGWDVKMADFNNGGNLAIAQADGFVKGKVNRWPQLQEIAMSNDNLLADPLFWPHVRDGDDIGGSQRLHFYVKDAGGRYVDLAKRLGLGVPVPTRGIATGDSDGDGRMDLAVARQWDEPVFYHNASPSPGSFLGLRLTHAETPGSPVVDAQVTAVTSNGRRFVSHVDGGGGHSGKRSDEVHIGLGRNVTGPVRVGLRWRDRTGQVRTANLQLNPGWHSLQLGSQAKER